MVERITLASLHERVTALEDLASDITKIKNLVKTWGPIIVAAALSSGIVSGKWGAFLHALFTGAPIQ